MTSEAGKRPEYERPPVSEVVCGVAFEPLQHLLAPYLGLLWEKYKPDYPGCEEAPVIVSPSDQPPVFDMVPLPRVWFKESSGNRLIQVQRDRFLHNWRRRSPDDEYPRHEQVLGLFHERLETFRSFIAEHGLGEIQAKQYELSYINYIPFDDPLLGHGLLTSVADIGAVFPDFSWRNRPGRPMGDIEAVNWKTVFSLPNKAGKFYVTIRNAAISVDEQQQPILFFELTARGLSGSPNLDGIADWFDMAHGQIVQSFADLVDQGFQDKVFGRIP